jgi:hypothetical protein
MKPTLVTLPAHNSKPPHTCVVSGRRDGECVDFQKDFVGRDPHIYIRRHRVEEAAKDLCGMVKKDVVDALQAELAAAEEERDRLIGIVAAGKDLSAAEDRLREALGPASTNE